MLINPHTPPPARPPDRPQKKSLNKRTLSHSRQARHRCELARASTITGTLREKKSLPHGLLCEYMGHDVSNMRGFDSYRLLTLSLAALMTRISSVVIEVAHTSAGAATLARTVPFWGRFRSPREPTAGPCRGCLLPSATNTAPSRHHLQAVLCDGWDVQTPPSWLLRPQTRELYGWS